MQGHEAKQDHIASYAHHSNVKNRSSLVFRHDYISKIWLSLQQPFLLAYHRTKLILVPTRIQDDTIYCHCGFLNVAGTGKCFYHEITAEIIKSGKSGEITTKLSAILK